MQTCYCHLKISSSHTATTLVKIELPSQMEVRAIIAGLLWHCSAEFIEKIDNFGPVQYNNITSKRKYLPHYHVSAPMGWLNHPAGFTFFERQYHIFYQYHPYNGAWDQVQWGHAVSDNLIDWRHFPPAIIPRESYETQGCLAGTALVQNKYMTLFYTGNSSNGNYTERSQDVAISSDGIVFQKYLFNPVIKAKATQFHNPKVWRKKQTWYMFCGMNTERGLGALALYSSQDMLHWHFNGTVAQSYGDMGYMWECPDYFELDGAHVLILSVRGIQTEGFRFRNLYQTGYVVGTFSYRTGRFEESFEVSAATFNEIDFGHDFYATQTMLTRDGRRLMIAWLGMWQSKYLESDNGWATMLTLIRELKLSDQGRLLMQPLKEMVKLRSEIVEEAWYLPTESFPAGTKAFELLINSTKRPNEVLIALEWRGGKYVIQFKSKKGIITINRGGIDGLRGADWNPTTVSLRIFVDYSSVEVFCGNGEVVFSSRIYPKGKIRVRVGGDSRVHVLLYQLRRSIGYDNRIRKHLMNNSYMAPKPPPTSITLLPVIH